MPKVKGEDKKLEIQNDKFTLNLEVVVELSNLYNENGRKQNS